MTAQQEAVKQEDIGRKRREGLNSALWGKISTKLNGRSAADCRKRYLKNMSATANKSVWRSGEERVLFQLQVRALKRDDYVEALGAQRHPFVASCLTDTVNCPPHHTHCSPSWATTGFRLLTRSMADPTVQSRTATTGACLRMVSRLVLNVEHCSRDYDISSILRSARVFSQLLCMLK